jgi:hypothetical protein
MKNRYLRAVLLFLGLAGVAAYFFYPNEQKQECINTENIYPYMNSENEVVFIETDSLSFKCILAKESGNCGFGIHLSKSDNDFKNWNLMDSLILNMQSSKDFKEVIAQILTYESGHTSLDDRSTMKPFIKEIELSPNKTRYSMPMQHFYAPDYWFEQQKARNTGNHKKFSAVIDIEIYSGWKNDTFKPLELKIENICLKGANNAPFVILVLYIAILIAIAISVRTKS